MKRPGFYTFAGRVVLCAGALLSTWPASAQSPAAVVAHDLSPWSMFLAADIVVKTVMIGLASASLIAWTIYIGKLLELRLRNARMRRAIADLGQQPSLAAAQDKVSASLDVVPSLLESARQEIVMSELASDKAGVKERVNSRLSSLVARAARRSAAGTGILASIGSTAPFIGLFGTVWGIMNSFIGISKAQTTNLAVVAPGIAEALLATAIGLVAAIPAVMFYNHLTRVIGAYRALVSEAAEEVMRLVSRDLDRTSMRAARFPEAINGR